MLRPFTLAAVTLAVACFVLAISQWSVEDQRKAREAEAERLAMRNAPRVTAVQLHAAYAENPVRAEEKYGTWVRVAGEVKAFGQSGGTPTLRLAVGNPYDYVRAECPYGGDREALSRLNKGDRATLHCAVDKMWVGNLYLEACSFE